MKPKQAGRAETRREEARRMLSEQRGTLWQRVTRRVNPGSALIWLGFYLGVLVIMLAGGSAMPWRLNEVVTSDITARVAFDIEDTARTEQERQVAAASAPDVYVQNPAPLAAIRGKLTDLLALVKAAGSDPTKLREQLAAKGWALDDAAIELLMQHAADQARAAAFENMTAELIERLGENRVVQKPAQPVRQGTPRMAILRSGEPGNTQDIDVPVRQLVYVSDTKSLSDLAGRIASVFPQPFHPAIIDLIVRTLQGSTGKDATTLSPLWRYDSAATLDAIKQAQEQVKVFTVHKVPGDLMVKAGTKLSNAELDLLAKEHEAYLRAAQTDRWIWREQVRRDLGLAAVVLLVTAGLACYSTIYQRRVLERPTRTLAMALMMAAAVLCSRFVAQVPEFAVGFLVAAAMLLSIAYNQRFAFGVSGELAILVTLACQGDFWLFLTLISGMSVAVFTLREVRSRSKVVGVGLMAAVAAFVMAVATRSIDGQPMRYILEHALAAGGAAMFAGFFVQGILPHFEKVFGITTSMTLLEWCDASQPLLRRLAQQAPGTYSHALVLSQMCDEAAQSIGANGLLARVGALYHDIGKTQKPAYFVENQEAQMNRHQRLSPTMSLLIITGHVKDGLEMARAYGLPRALHQFILEHHGTTIVKYFHHAASEAAAKTATGKHDREVAESEFRYPGPKPRMPESAILMLCDGCEGAVRAITEPTPGRIESTVHQVVMARLTDGQFDNCDITLKDLHVVEQSIVKSLCAIHHGRIKYPSKEGPRKPAERAPAKPAGESGETANGGQRSPATEVARQA
ncbi:MAG TPA: HDIG domain-containing protein [Phycisphaerae bacterium]|nr:HDIG domain-containing protein [Phycisphaerae bacterium]